MLEVFKVPLVGGAPWAPSARAETPNSGGWDRHPPQPRGQPGARRDALSLCSTQKGQAVVLNYIDVHSDISLPLSTF